MPFLYYTHKKLYLKNMDCSENKTILLLLLLLLFIFF